VILHGRRSFVTVIGVSNPKEGIVIASALLFALALAGCDTGLDVKADDSPVDAGLDAEGGIVCNGNCLPWEVCTLATNGSDSEVATCSGAGSCYTPGICASEGVLSPSCSASAGVINLPFCEPLEGNLFVVPVTCARSPPATANCIASTGATGGFCCEPAP
jgi:hypothetical protein